MQVEVYVMRTGRDGTRLAHTRDIPPAQKAQSMSSGSSTTILVRCRFQNTCRAGGQAPEAAVRTIANEHRRKGMEDAPTYVHTYLLARSHHEDGLQEHERRGTTQPTAPTHQNACINT